MSEAPRARLAKALAAHHPLIYVLAQEERRLEHVLAALAAERYGAPRPITAWTGTRGFTVEGRVVEPACEPLAALRHLLESAEPGFYLLKDFPLLLAADPRLVRALRDLYEALAERDVFVFLSCPQLVLPDALARHVFMVDLGMPDEAELAAELAAVLARHPPPAALPQGWIARCAAAMKGMTVDEAGHLARRLVAEGKLDLDACLAEVREEKGAALMREACLKFIPSGVDIARVGGLENLKEWVLSRRAFFTGEANTAGVPLPSGVLFMGVSGCGKSMAAKLVAGAWGLPLVRLDMNLVLSGAYGAPEFAFDRSLRTAEAIAPVVLWIDEMENSFGYDTETRGGGNNQNVFASFLTWMQEKPAGVFVVATANRIEKLPAEVIRKGRFDQLFFLDLPGDEERASILEIHLRAAGGDPAAFNLKALAALTRGWSGAEIEQGVQAAVVHAWQEGRAFTERDVMWSASRIVPLSRTMEEQIKQLRFWSQERATPASRKPAA